MLMTERVQTYSGAKSSLYHVFFMRQEQDHVFSFSPSALPVNFLGEERGWSYMKVVIWVASYIKRDDLSLCDSQDRTVCGYECVFVCFCVCSHTYTCVPESMFTHALFFTRFSSFVYVTISSPSVFSCTPEISNLITTFWCWPLIFELNSSPRHVFSRLSH